MIMDTTSTGNITQQQSPAYALMKRGKRGAAALIAIDCCNVAAAAAATQQQHDDGNGEVDAADSALIRCKLLDNMLDVLLNPYDAIGEWNNLDWLRWLMAGGKTLDEFSSAVKDYDYGTCCGLVWTANYVAYRCRTCSISPCMSLCGECFKRGDHTGHDFNMFRSQAGGACDCGDTSVMKPDGFCRKHSSTNNLDGSSSISNYKQPPADLLRVAERIFPRLLLRLVQYLRENSKIDDSRATNVQNVPAGGVTGANAGISNQQQQHLLLLDLDPFLGMLHDLSGLGAAMRRVMTVSLTSEKIYRWACDYYTNTSNIVDNESSPQQQQQQTIYTIYTDKVRRYYAEAIHQYTSSSSSRRRRHSNTSDVSADVNVVDNISSSSNSEDDDEFNQDDWVMDGSSQKNKLNHSSFLQEIVFWTVQYEFPQKMVCLLLNMLPDAAYKEALTEAFVMHYGCVARVLATTRDSDTLSNHIVHISVQLFSNEALATRMVDKLGLLRVMVSSLRRMMIRILIPSTLHDSNSNRHWVVDCSKAVMKEHCYWPLVSDLNNVLSHRPIAVKFMCDERLLDSWFSYLSMFQGMNVNCRELGHHVEFEPNTYYAAFSAELEASAYPMWAMLSHLTSAETWPLTSAVLRACLYRLRKWLVDVGYYNNQRQDDNYTASSSTTCNSSDNLTKAIVRQSDDRHQFTFHLPLHRYLSVFLCQAVRAQGARVEDVITPASKGDTASRDAILLAIATHPVRAQAAFYEIMQGAWVRNGLQIKGQAMTYIQSNFCISMVDADIYLLQLCLSELSDVNIFMSLILEKFKAYDWMRVLKHGGLPQVMDSAEYDAAPSMESLLVFLATLVGVRTNLCADEYHDYCQSQLEMVTLLCVSDKTHSQLMELMPERCGNGSQANNTTTKTTTSTSTSGDGTSQNLPSLSQESPSCLRDFETVLKVVAEYKRPQFEASGNMQQGLYVPLAHVWRNLYDPVHVLLRAVHRRDFQSSMDRYTAFMRSIGLLQQNQTPWPPYRTPHPHHPAYRDPCRALLSKLFHSVTWHCLYRSAVYRDVSEHTLSLLVYLLDQAWICYKTDEHETTSNLQQPMNSRINTENIMCPKKRIKLSTSDSSSFTYENDKDTPNSKSVSRFLLDCWYDQDDLEKNLCTTITHVELPPPYFHYYFGTSAEDAPNTTTNTAAASTMAINLFDYFTSSVAAATSVASSSSPVSNDLETANSLNQQSNSVPSLAVIASNEIPITPSRSSQSTSTATRPPFYSLNAAAAATSSTMDSALNHVKQRLQFLRPPPPKMTTPLNVQQQQSSSSSSEQQQMSIDDDNTAINYHLENLDNTLSEDATMGSTKQDFCYEKDDTFVAESNYNDNQQHPLVCINESIISLLLRLHSVLSGKPDSYQPPRLTTIGTSSGNFKPTSPTTGNVQEKIPSCGDGAYYVGRLLDKIARGSSSCYECVVRSRLSLWPKAVVMRETATREDEERERRERKRRARDKQQQMMEEMARAQRAFLENARRSGDLDATESEVQSQSTNTNSLMATNMECDEPVAITETPTITTSTEASTSSSSNIGIDIDENSSSSNSTITTIKESVVCVRGTNQQETTQTVDCVICNQTAVVQIEQQRRDPVGLVILVQGTNILAHRRHIQSPTATNNENSVSNSNTDTSQKKLQQSDIDFVIPNNSNINNDRIEDDEQNYYHYWPALPPLQPQQQQHNNQSTSIDEECDLQKLHQPLATTIIDDEDMTTYASHCDRRKQLLTQCFDHLDKADYEIGSLTTATSPTPIGGNVHVQTCGHHLHLRCWSSYLSSLRGAQRFNSDRGEYSCPLCRQLANSLMPLIPAVPIDQHRGTTTNTSTLVPDALNELTRLIKLQESVPPNLSLFNNAISGESSQSVTGDGDQPQRLHQRYILNDAFSQNHTHDNTIGTEGVTDNGGIGEGGVENGEDPLLDAVNRCVSDMITTTVVTAAAQTFSLPPTLLSASQRDKMYKVRWHSVVSVAWTNIQVELVQRNNSLRRQLQQELELLYPDYFKRQNKHSLGAASTTITDISGSNNYYNMLPKRNCIAPLLKVLSVSARSLLSKYQTIHNYPLSDIWFRLIGVARSQEFYKDTDPPLLMRDPCSLLLQLVLMLPTLECDLFDTLVKITFNMQLFEAALKVAVAWNNDGNTNQQDRLHHNSLDKSNQSSITTEKTCISDNKDIPMDIDDSNINMLHLPSSMDTVPPLISLLRLQSPSPPLFSQAVALAKDIVIDHDKKSKGTDENEFVMDYDKVEITSEDSEKIALLESYGRQCTLPFLRFAALLKKYTYGDNIDNLDEHHEMITISSPPQQSNSELQKPKEQLLYNQTQPSHNKKYSPLSESNYNDDNLIKNSLFRRQNLCHYHWSLDDYEFVMLARYLKLLNDDETNENCDGSGANETNNFCENKQKNTNSEIKQQTLIQPPSAMEAVSWPMWAYTSDDNTDKVSTVISCSWLSSFREALTKKLRKTITANDCNVVLFTTPASEIDSKNKSSINNINMAARLFLNLDCCEGSGVFNYKKLRSISDSGRGLLPTIQWTGPRLLKLPHLYDDVFQYYHGRPCHRCHGVPRETSVCLVCGTVVCLKENCCKTNGIYEAVQHSLECGGGTGMFLVVTSSSVVVIRGKRACLWGSVYLDAFGEEDRELKRGKPLYLSAERYRLLERQWLAHRFDHTNKKWVWHRDAL